MAFTLIWCATVRGAVKIESGVVCRFTGPNNEPINGIIVKYSGVTQDARHETWSTKLNVFDAQFVSRCNHNTSRVAPEVLDVNEMTHIDIPNFVKEHYNGHVWTFCDGLNWVGTFYPSSNVMYSAEFNGPSRAIQITIPPNGWFDKDLRSDSCRPVPVDNMIYDTTDTSSDFTCTGGGGLDRYKLGQIVKQSEGPNPCTTETCTAEGTMEENMITCEFDTCPEPKVSTPRLGCCTRCLEENTNNCGRHACHKHADCTNGDILGFSCACKVGFDGDGFDCMDVDECAAGGPGSKACDAETTTCVNTDGSYECQCKEGLVRVSETECEKPKIAYKVLNVSHIACCSHISDHGAVVLQVFYRSDNSVDHAEKVACIHPTKRPLESPDEYSRPLEINSKDIENIVITYAQYVQMQSPEVNIHSKLKYGNCYRTIGFFKGPRDTNKKQEVYYVAEKLNMYRMMTDRYVAMENRCHLLPKYPTEFIKYAMKTVSPPKEFGPCKDGSATNLPSSYLLSIMATIVMCVVCKVTVFFTKK